MKKIIHINFFLIFLSLIIMEIWGSTKRKQVHKPDIVYPVVTTYGLISLDEQKKIRMAPMVSDTSIKYINVYRIDELPDYYIVQYSKYKFARWNFLILTMDLEVIYNSNWEEGDHRLGEPIVIDIDQDSRMDLIVSIEFELDIQILVYLQRDGCFELAFESPLFESLVQNPETMEYIQNSYYFKNLDDDKDFELFFNYLDVNGDFVYEKNVIYDLQGVKYVLLMYD